LRELVDEQVRTRSPRPEAETGHLGKAAGDEGGAGVLAEAPAFHDSAGDGEHVLDRTADLRSDDVVRQIGTEERLGDAGAERLSDGSVLDREGDSRWKARRNFVGEGGTGKDCDRRGRLLLARNFVHQPRRCLLHAL
jgi:hypothetical protein